MTRFKATIYFEAEPRRTDLLADELRAFIEFIEGGHWVQVDGEDVWEELEVSHIEVTGAYDDD